MSIDKEAEAKFWQDYLDNEDAELDRLNNAIWPEVALSIVATALVGLAIYALLA